MRSKTPVSFLTNFEERKQKHIHLALKKENQAISAFETIHLPHNALPGINFQDIQLESFILGQKRKSPFYIAAMTAGHSQAGPLNKIFAEACKAKGWILGVGSQRRQLFDPEAFQEWTQLKKYKITLLSNIGLTQAIELVQKNQISQILQLVESLEAQALAIHTNPLQEALQPEGTPQFKNDLQAIEKICKEIKVPIILKETGCGFSKDTLQKLNGIGLAAVDVSGMGGTHWGRIEGQRSPKNSLHFKAAQVFRQWGNTTVESLCSAQEVRPDYEVWASGGLRSGLDVAKAMALGASAVGFAQPALKKALEGGVDALIDWMSQIEYELKVALFCLGLINTKDLKSQKINKKVEFI